ncbi:MAG TPA: polysaccharide deacetylase family protein [Candidatus Baltobacteraceae bacterium]|nr:polysaccharide deacetylase family protein [Candidatus Baltobacteraceae bacterium]
MGRPLVTLLLILLFGTAATGRAPDAAASLPAAFVPPPILMYHRIDTDRPADLVGRELTVSPEQFSGQLAYLRAHGIAGISMEQLRERLEAGAPLDHTVVLTFDDGYADQYENALPLLHQYADQATFYVVTGLLDTPRHLTWAQLAVMRALGEDISAHGVAHDDLSRMSPAQQTYQIEDSIALLRRRLHARVGSYCYPSGRFNRTTLAIVQSAGVDLAVTTDASYVIAPENRFELPRIRVRGDWRIGDFAAALQSGLEKARIVRT